MKLDHNTPRSNQLWGPKLEQNCETCRYGAYLDWNMRCTRYPPFKSIHNNMSDGFPLTVRDFWCGEWQPEFIEDKLEPTRV